MKKFDIGGFEVTNAGLNEFISITDLGKLFGVSRVKMGKWLVECGLREKLITTEDEVCWVPSAKAKSGDYLKESMGSNELPFYLWEKTRTIFALKQAGHVLPDSKAE